jgi:hypothetical protein
VPPRPPKASKVAPIINTRGWNESSSVAPTVDIGSVVGVGTWGQVRQVGQLGQVVVVAVVSIVVLAALLVCGATLGVVGVVEQSQLNATVVLAAAVVLAAGVVEGIFIALHSPWTS